MVKRLINLSEKATFSTIVLIAETVFWYPPYTIWPNLFPPPCWAEFQNCTLTRMALYRRLPDVLMMLLKGMMMIVDDCHFESAYLQELRAWVFFSTALEWCSWSCSVLIPIHPSRQEIALSVLNFYAKPIYPQLF